MPTGRLTTHVLDSAAGTPAAGVAIELWRWRAPEPPVLLKIACTNQDGRTNEPLLSAAEIAPGWYELIFMAGDYFGKPIEERFLDRVPVRFQILDANGHYHVPLLMTPWAYQTYRGS
jgi:5-hydroxyisourate hydrolase